MKHQYEGYGNGTLDPRTNWVVYNNVGDIAGSGDGGRTPVPDAATLTRWNQSLPGAPFRLDVLDERAATDAETATVADLAISALASNA